MPLITCPTCQNNISSEAVSCPQCGHPTKSTIEPTVTTQQTSKTWKLLQLIGALMAIVGIAVKASGGSGNWTYAAMVGLLLFIAGRFWGWWNHG